MMPHYYNSVENGVLVQLKNQNKYLIIDCSIEQYEKGLKEYNNGALIQNAFPFLSPNEREFLLTGLPEEEWDDLFGER